MISLSVILVMGGDTHVEPLLFAPIHPLQHTCRSRRCPPNSTARHRQITSCHPSSSSLFSLSSFLFFSSLLFSSFPSALPPPLPYSNPPPVVALCPSHSSPEVRGTRENERERERKRVDSLRHLASYYSIAAIDGILATPDQPGHTAPPVHSRLSEERFTPSHRKKPQ